MTINEILMVSEMIEILRIVVPASLIAEAILLATSERSHKPIPIVVLGVMGGVGYMALNAPQWEWIPLWITHEHWVLIAMLALMAMGLLIFLAEWSMDDPFGLEEDGDSGRTH